MSAMTLDITQTRPTSFARLVTVELRKSVDTRAGRWLLIAIVGITALIMGIFFAVADAEDRIFENFIGIAGTPQGFLLPVLGILLVTSEWTQRTALTTFALAPSRSRVIAAKTAAALLFGLGAFFAALLLAGLATLAGGSGDGFEGLSTATFALFLALQLLTILQGLAYGMLWLNTPAAIVTFFVLPIASSIIFSLVPGLVDAAPWVDLNTAQSPLFDGQADLTGEEYARIATTSLIWIVAPFVAGWVRISRAELK